MSLARNAPCPCGSGRKYKRCCGGQKELPDPTEEDRRDAFAALEDHLYLPRFREHREWEMTAFRGAWASALGERQVDRLLRHPITRIAWTCHVAIDSRLPGRGTTVARDLLERRGQRLPFGTRRALEDLAASRPDLYELRALKPGSLEIARLGAEADVATIPGPFEPVDLAPGDLLAARLVRTRDGHDYVGDLYVYPAAFRGQLLASLTDDVPRVSRVFHELWLLSRPDRLPPAGRARYPHLSACLRDYLDGEDLSIRVPKEVRAIGLYIGRIAAAVSPCEPDQPIDTLVPCRRRPGRRACPGTIIARTTQEAVVQWECPRCGDSGTTTAWQDTPFDQRGRAPDTTWRGEPLLTIFLPASAVRRLQRLVHISAPALRALSSEHPARGGEARLLGTAGELLALARCMAFHVARDEALSVTAADELEHLHAALCTLAGGRPDLSPAAQCAEVLLFERSRRARPRPTGAAPSGSHRLHVRLLDIAPPIWRRLELPSRFTLEDLYEALILAFGWSNTHIHLFVRDGRRYGRPSPDWHEPVQDERVVLLADALPHTGDRMIFEYDLGDSWRHEIVVEELSPDGLARPRLVAGARACPPEDCGGPPGYEDLLAALSDPFHPEHEHLRRWSNDHDPEAFELEAFDERVASMDGAGVVREAKGSDLPSSM